MSHRANIRDVQETVFILVLFVYAAHQGSSRWKNFIDEDEDGFLRRKLDALTDHIDKLAHGEIGRDKIFLLVDGGNVGLLDLLTDDLQRSSHISRYAKGNGWAWDAATYGDAVCVLLADTLSLCLTLLERVLVFKLGAHDV